MATSKFLVPVLSFLAISMLIGAFLQVAFLQCLEETNGLPFWENDKEAKMLRIGLIKQEVVSWSPRITLLHNFLSSEECDYLISLAQKRLGKSTVVDEQTGKGIESNVRTSSGMFLSPAESKYSMIQALEKRISTYAMVPLENGELIQVLRYGPNQFYEAHHDYFSDEVNLKRGGQRIATMLMYLNNVTEGGETHFPLVEGEQCSCGGELKKGISVKPKKGNAVLFWSQTLDGNVDPMSLHASCRVLKGDKWSAPKWMRQRPMD